MYEFATELVDIFPNTHFVKRKAQFEMRHIIEFSKNRDFTDIMVINEDRKEPSKHKHPFHLGTAIEAHGY